MKFGKEFKSQMVPEWQDAYMSYDYMKTLLKDIFKFKQSRKPASVSANLRRKMSMYRTFSGLTRAYSNLHSQKMEDQVVLVNSSPQEEGSDRYQSKFLMSSDEGGEYELVFFRRLDDELNKVNTFYKARVEEVISTAESLNKQMNALIAFRIIVAKLDYDPNEQSPTSVVNGASSTPISNTVVRSNPGKRSMDLIEEVEMSSEGLSEEPVVANVVSRIDNKRRQQQKLNVVGPRPAPLEVLNHVKINVTIETPVSTIKSILMDSRYKDLDFSKTELIKVEQQLKKAFIEFYQELCILKGYSFLNLLAFSKIMKKYDKITTRSASKSYLKLVDNSYLGSSEEVSKIMERVEVAFIKHFSNSNRSKGIKTLRPRARRERHRVTFFLGFFTGCSIALLVALLLIIHIRHLTHNPGRAQYMEIMFPLYSIFGFIVLHMMMYAANIYFWRRYRVNYPFIFGFKPGTELGYREVFLLGTGLAVLALAAVISNLDMEMDPKTMQYRTLTELVPLGLVLLLLLITFCPFNIIYRSSRFFLLRCTLHSICAPLYKVSLPDFFVADQLTSQVQAFRDLQFYICYYGWGDFKQRKNNCSTNRLYIIFYFIVAVIPFWIRFLQCLRRMLEEKDRLQGYNSLKYLSIIVAVVMRTAYRFQKEMRWKLLSGITSAIVTIVSTYWDIVIDWGLLRWNSQNPWLREKLLVSRKSVYFAAMVLNILLRLAWLQSVLNFRVSFMSETGLVAFVACLEIIRRGLWNFFRLENEHLNNVENYRAFKTVPLPFSYNEDKDDE